MGRYVATNKGQFVRKIAIDYVRYGYVRYVLRQIPEGKNLAVIDQKLITHYQVTFCRTTRMRRRRKQQAVVQYVRYGHSFVLLATEGIHEQFDRVVSYDCRTSPLYFDSYAIGIKNGKVRVTIRRGVWAMVCDRFKQIGLHHTTKVEQQLGALPFCNFPGVVRQKQALVSCINERRDRAGLPRVSLRQPVKTFCVMSFPHLDAR